LFLVAFSVLAGLIVPATAGASSSSQPGVTSSTITVGNVATITGPVPGLFEGAQVGTNGEVTILGGEPTGRTPGRLVRNRLATVK